MDSNDQQEMFSNRAPHIRKPNITTTRPNNREYIRFEQYDKDGSATSNGMNEMMTERHIRSKPINRGTTRGAILGGQYDETIQYGNRQYG